VTTNSAADRMPVLLYDTTLRMALGNFFPQLDAVHLVDYKERILADSREYALRLQGGEITRRIERDSTNGHLA
jgi:hypothetical protein